MCAGLLRILGLSRQMYIRQQFVIQLNRKYTIQCDTIQYNRNILSPRLCLMHHIDLLTRLYMCLMFFLVEQQGLGICPSQWQLVIDSFRLKSPLHEQLEAVVTAKCRGHRQRSPQNAASRCKLSLQDRTISILRWQLPCRQCN